MEYVKLGKSGLKVSRLCLGCMSYGVPERGAHPWTLGEEESRPFLARALELGINFFDTSNSYSDGTSEEILGRAIRDLARRDEVVIATKVYFPTRKDPNGRGLSRKAILSGDRREPPAARHRLRRPVPDPPLGLRDADRGDARGAARRREGGQGPLPRRLVDVRLAVLQGAPPGRPPRLDAVRLDAGPLQPALPRGGAGDAGPLRRRGDRRAPLEPARPRAAGPAVGPEGGARSGRPRTSSARPSTPGRRRPTARSSTALGEVAAARGVPRAQVALAWLLGKPAVTSPIVGATKPHHLEDAVAALSIELTPEEMARLEEPYVPHPVLGFS